VLAVIPVMGLTSGHRVKRSTAVRQNVNPSDVGKGPIKSTWVFRKRDSGSVKITQRNEGVP
jgi:hypothetical protein